MRFLPPRHWFRFSLRNLLGLVALLAVGIGYPTNWIRQRHAFLAQELAVCMGSRGWVSSYEYMSDHPVTSDSKPAPALLRPFGERGRIRVFVWCDDTTRANPARLLERAAQARWLFPESEVFFIHFEFDRRPEVTLQRY